MDRENKEKRVLQIQEILASPVKILMLKNQSMSAEEIGFARNAMDSAGVRLLSVKNTLFQVAIARLARDTFSELGTYCKGDSMIAYGEDLAAISKCALKIIKEKGAVYDIVVGFDGETILNKKQVEAVASLPSLLEARGMFLGVLGSPLSKLLATFNEKSQLPSDI